MTDARQAAERARVILDDFLRDSGHQHWADVENCPSFECRLSTVTRELVVALADTERERDEALGLLDNERLYTAEHRGYAQIVGDENEHLKARVAELEAAPQHDRAADALVAAEFALSMAEGPHVAAALAQVRAALAAAEPPRCTGYCIGTASVETLVEDLACPIHGIEAQKVAETKFPDRQAWLDSLSAADAKEPGS